MGFSIKNENRQVATGGLQSSADNRLNGEPDDYTEKHS
jgi:hypothetical protein